MKFGWVDFSKEDKTNAISIIQTLENPGVLDELGFGVLRNAFANEFFPGTSTLHTRAKYLYLIPYLLYEFQQKCAGGKIPPTSSMSNFIKVVGKQIDDAERNIKNLLMKNGKGEQDGVIGSSVKKESYWVERTPIIIYWTGLRTYNFIRNALSLGSISYNELLVYFYTISRNIQEEKNVVTSKKTEIKNDAYAGERSFFPVKKGLFTPNWRNNLSIELNQNEARDLKQRIVECEVSKNSLFALILRENLLPDASIEMDFEGFVESIKENKAVPESIKRKLYLACRLNDFYYIVILRYYYLLDKKIFFERWNIIKSKIRKISEDFNPEEIFLEMKISNKPKLLRFLRDVKKELLQATKNGNYTEVDKLITAREIAIKTSRAKIGHPDKYTKEELENIKVMKFSYRFFIAKRYVLDIQKGLKKHA